MTPEVCIVKIEELEEIQASIAQRIKELKDHAGIAANFYEQLTFVKEDALRLMQDRFDEDDDQSIWAMVEMLRELTAECLNYLKPHMS